MIKTTPATPTPETMDLIKCVASLCAGTSSARRFRRFLKCSINEHRQSASVPPSAQSSAALLSAMWSISPIIASPQLLILGGARRTTKCNTRRATPRICDIRLSPRVKLQSTICDGCSLAIALLRIGSLQGSVDTCAGEAYRTQWFPSASRPARDRRGGSELDTGYRTSAQYHD